MTSGGSFIKDNDDNKKIQGGTDNTLIGNVGDRLKVSAEVTFPEGQPVTLPEYEDILYRLRTTQPRQLFAGQWGFNGQPLVWSSLITGNATIDEPSTTGHNFIKFNTTSTSGDKAIYQTQRYFQYQPSRNHSLTFAAALGPSYSNKVLKVGLFDDSSTEGQNGWYVQRDSSGIQFVVASTASGSQSYIQRARATWNVDKLDGTGPSGLNFTDAQLERVIIWNIDYSWYGASVVQFNIIYGSTRVVCHEETFSLVYADHPFTKTAFLPLRLEVENTGPSTASSVTLGSISLDIENGEGEESGFQWSVANGTTGISVTGATPAYIIAVRPRLTVNGIENRGVIIPNNVRVLSTDDVFLEVLVGGDATGGTWTNLDTSRSISEYSVNFTGYTGGRVVYSDYIAAGGGRATGALATSFPGDLFAAIDSLLGTQQAFAVRATRLVGNSTVYGALSFKEIY